MYKLCGLWPACLGSLSIGLGWQRVGWWMVRSCPVVPARLVNMIHNLHGHIHVRHSRRRWRWLLPDRGLDRFTVSPPNKGPNKNPDSPPDQWHVWVGEPLCVIQVHHLWSTGEPMVQVSFV